MRGGVHKTLGRRDGVELHDAAVRYFDHLRMGRVRGDVVEIAVGVAPLLVQSCEQAVQDGERVGLLRLGGL